MYEKNSSADELANEVPKLKFFIPCAASAEQAEDVYIVLSGAVGPDPLRAAKLRTFSYTFTHEGSEYKATVGKTIDRWPVPTGPVLAIIETNDLVYVHTVTPNTRSGIYTILAGPPQEGRRIYFDG